jgi:protein translocase SecG subunit
MISWSLAVKNLFNLITVISAILMVVSILVQNRGQSLGVSFGGDNSSYRSKRGSELVLYNATIVLAIIFTLSIILSILLKK